MSTPSTEWPPYLAGPPEHFHALGIIAGTFNILEHRLMGLFLLYVGFNDVSAMIFRKTRDNGTRMNWLRAAVDLHGESDAIKDSTHYFCAGFHKCAEHRNILMHSGITTLAGDGKISHLVFTKARKDDPLGWNRYFIDRDTLRSIADNTHAFAEYGRGLFDHIVTNHRSEDLIGPTPLPPSIPLPERPALLDSLIPQPLPNPTTQQPPPRSSQA